MPKAILVAIQNGNENINYSFDEMANLAKECDIEVIGRVVQKGKINPKTYIGLGKLEELIVDVKLDNPDYVIFNDELSPLMLKNLNDAIPCQILDRSLVILDIFLRHAKTREAKLEIELAHLKYLLPRLSSLRDGFDRQGGVGSKGSGEKQIELDRRKISSDILRIERELAEIHKMKDTQIAKRKKNMIKTVALVGYTNAGKSSTMNTLLNYVNESKDKNVLAENRLFATLQTSVRQLEYQNVKFLLSDTVGFVSKLPTLLIHSFNETLAEVCEADLILHVLDISSDFALEQFSVTMNVLKALGVDENKILVLLNKTDLCENIPRVAGANFMAFSNKSGLNVKSVLDYIKEKITDDYLPLSIRIPYSDAKILNFVIENTNIISKLYEPDGISIELLCPKRYLSRIISYQINSTVS